MSAAPADPAAADADRFGREALGPVLAEFCLRLWLTERFLPDAEDATLLFCARGGLRLKLLYERFLARTGLPARVPAAALMVSRLVAARTALEPPGEGVLSELGREFSGRPMSEVAAALAQRQDLALPAAWDAPFAAGRFAALLAADEPAAAALRGAIAEQDARFRRHVDACTGGRRHGLLVDTGLYGSTVRLLQDGIPAMRWSGLQFARSNYKRLPTPHFARTLGLSVESDSYRPWETCTAALRFWHLIEAALEPDLPSVRLFADADGDGPPRANLEVAGWEARIEPEGPGLFAGALAHVETLRPDDLHRVPAEAARGWRAFKRAVVWPDARMVAALELADRSRDFGRLEKVAQFAAPGGTLAQIRDSLWREGALMRRFPRAGRAGLVLIELAHAARTLRLQASALRRRAARPALQGAP
ncbi:glycosyltransferase [Methylobacterium dankookense]|uniref:Uncharacterized protein n=1 Tax=Methylobacterium dankookense TaxID=560405 RepID=A0A564FX63_9HYPH|nr:glycosyltransferase [Methylobacterium dankookense]GJD54719.1 hypothetical protein IFDJLNFL_0598 [Methylobacterium dankookense]VUF12587.1 hypothetical protein MTDSW087_02280 [Methylobacterium dankookense]